MAKSLWVATKASGLWKFGGFYDPPAWNKTDLPQQPPGTYDPDLDVVVDMGERHHDPRLERWDGALGSRAATPAEITAYDAAERDRVFAAEADDARMMKAMILWLAGKLGVTPATARTEIRAIYRGL